MPHPSLPTIPPSEPAPYRHLGQGVGERSMRVQMVVALVAGLVMVAVPLYLWRRPRADMGSDSLPAHSPENAPKAVGSISPIVTPITLASSLPASGRNVATGEPKIIKCTKPGPGKTPPEQCDHQSTLEEAFVKAIQDNGSCAPAVPTGGTVSYVFDVDHSKKTLKVWIGKSGSIKKTKTKDALACIKRALPTPDWSQLTHQHTKYQISILATYPPVTPGSP